MYANDRSGSGSNRWRQRHCVVVVALLSLVTIITTLQFYYSITLRASIKDDKLSSLSISIPLRLSNYSKINDTTTAADTSDGTVIATTSTTTNDKSSKEASKGFGACLMIKEDNDLLYEWIAYHYVTLPLRYLVVGSDLNNQQNPYDVLSLWDDDNNDNDKKNLGLKYWIINATNDFMYRHDKSGNSVKDDKKKNNTTANDAHHAFVNRQRGFITTCTELLKREVPAINWVVYIDSDEYIVMNHLYENDTSDANNNDDERTNQQQQALELRKQLPYPSKDNFQYPTIIDAIKKLNFTSTSSTHPKYNFTSCITMPRLLHGSLLLPQNKTCSSSTTASESNASSALEIAIENGFLNNNNNNIHIASNGNHREISTLLYHQHAKKDDFSMSKYSKVMIDISRIPDEVLSTKVPRNIHRPYLPFCGPAVIPFDESIFYINHYIGSWERYNSRIDNRRSYNEWSIRALSQNANFETRSCKQQNFINKWFIEFIKQVSKCNGNDNDNGLQHAKYLFGIQN